MHTSFRPMIMLVVLVGGCHAHRESVANTQAGYQSGANSSRIANLKRAARLPWTDDGRCAVRESSGGWATLVERCYDALDHSRMRFVDHKRVCPIAQAGTITADQLARLVGICLLVQPELAVGAVIVLGAFVVATAIMAEIEAAERAEKLTTAAAEAATTATLAAAEVTRKKGTRPCKFVGAGGPGLFKPKPGGDKVRCTYKCGDVAVERVYWGTSDAVCTAPGNVPTY